MDNQTEYDAGVDDATLTSAADDDYTPTAEEQNQAIAAAIVPKFAAALSLFGSCLMLYELYLDYRQGNARDGATARILVSMCISDIIFSTGWFLTTWPAPSELTDIPFALGNQATCTVQGFIIQLGGVASPLFNVSLALFFLLRIRYRWTDFRLKRRLEPWVQGCIWTFALVCAIYPIPLGLYNNNWEICWIESYPMDCLDSYRYGEDADCTRGDNAWIHALFFQVFPPWICVFCALICMGMIYASVCKVEHRNTRYGAGPFIADGPSSSDVVLATTTTGEDAQNSTLSLSACFNKMRASFRSSDGAVQPAHNASTRTTLNNASLELATAADNASPTSQQQEGGGGCGRTINTTRSTEFNTPPQRCHRPPRRGKRRNQQQRSDMVATQAMWYIAAFFATYVLDFISAVCWYVKDWWWFWLGIFAYFFLPLQGFFNFLVFMRTRKMKSRLGQCARKVLCCSSFEKQQGGSNDNKNVKSSLWTMFSMVMQKVRLCFSCHCWCCREKDQTAMPSGAGDRNSANTTPSSNTCTRTPDERCGFHSPSLAQTAVNVDAPQLFDG